MRFWFADQFYCIMLWGCPGSDTTPVDISAYYWQFSLHKIMTVLTSILPHLSWFCLNHLLLKLLWDSNTMTHTRYMQYLNSLLLNTNTPTCRNSTYNSKLSLQIISLTRVMIAWSWSFFIVLNYVLFCLSLLIFMASQSEISSFRAVLLKPVWNKQLQSCAFDASLK